MVDDCAKMLEPFIRRARRSSLSWNGSEYASVTEDVARIGTRSRGGRRYTSCQKTSAAVQLGEAIERPEYSSLIISRSPLFAGQLARFLLGYKA